VIPFASPTRRIPRAVRILLWIMGGLTLVAGMFLLLIPTLDGPHSRLFANEASAVSGVRTIITLQDQYSAAHAYTGFACELPLLKPLGQEKLPDHSLELLTSGVRSGYRFSLVGCGSDANRAKAHYQLTAVPVEQNKTGVRAFCADEAGVIWYDLAGSGTNCLASRNALQ
jgi:hypothetical protein